MGADLEKSIVKLSLPEEWHQRFLQQAGWTKNLRQYLYQLIKIDQAYTILEVGCGTGVLMPELVAISSAAVHGVDLNHSYLNLALQHAPSIHLCQADAYTLPYPNRIFDVTLCHFLLLWIQDPVRVLTEMARITKPGGFVIAMAEPDYSARIDFPPKLIELGKMQEKALHNQGADPQIGRRISYLISQAELELIESGLIGGRWHYPPDWVEWELEWSVLFSDLQEMTTLDKLNELREFDRYAWMKGQRMLYVPTFYSIGRVPLD